MLSVLIFLMSFLCLFGFSIVIPALPPGEIIHAFLGISTIASPISGISGAVLTNALINGFFWGTIILLIYILTTSFSRKKPLMPVGIKITQYPVLQKSTSEYIPPRPFIKKPIPNLRKRKTQVSLDQKVEKIEGIGQVYGNKLRKLGINSVNDLLNAGSTRKGRYDLAKSVGVSHSKLISWVNRADFFRINGIGKQYSSLLELSGVHSVTDLSIRDPQRLYEKMKQTNLQKSLVKRTPPFYKVKHWIESAKNLQSIVLY
jgi:predicted flap endonuclease-1-like 5' DNA nuclease